MLRFTQHDIISTLTLYDSVDMRTGKPWLMSQFGKDFDRRSPVMIDLLIYIAIAFLFFQR